MFREMDITVLLFAGILALLVTVSIVGQVLKLVLSSAKARAMLTSLNSRVGTWWAMCAVFTLAAVTGGVGSILVFGLTSFQLLREFITMTPTRRGDHHTLFWVFFIILPLQYYLLWIGWYGLFIILIPVYAFLFIPLHMALSGDTHGFLERAAKVQWALMICVYCVSHAPALLRVEFAGGASTGLGVLLYLCLVVQVNDLAQEIGKQALGNGAGRKRRLMGFAMGVLVSTGLGTGLWWATPFSALQSALISAGIAIMGTAGSTCYSAIMADRGKPGIVVVRTRPSVGARVISLCFVAPVFFHVVRYYFTGRPWAAF